MKRFCAILVFLLISITVVFAGSGISVMKCAHTDAIAFAYNLESEDDCNTENDCHSDGHHRQTKPCMQINVEQLAPSLTANGFQVDFSELQPVVAPMMSLLPSSEISEAAVDGRYFIREKLPLPPRLYLSRLCVLNI